MPNYDSSIQETESFQRLLSEAQQRMSEVATALDREGRFGKYGTITFNIDREFTVEIKRRGSDSRMEELP